MGRGAGGARARRGRGPPRRGRRPRPDRADARLGLPRRARRGPATGAAVERPADRRAVRVDHRARRRGPAAGGAGNPALTGFQAPKVRWLLDEEPEVAARVRTVLLPKDYVRLRLTGERATDASDASGTLLLDVRRARLVRRAARGARDPPGLAAGVREGTEAGRRAARRGGGRARAPARAAGRRGRGRQRRRGGRRRRGRRGARVLLDRHERRRVRAARRLHAGPVGPRARLLPRAARAPSTSWP